MQISVLECKKNGGVIITVSDNVKIIKEMKVLSRQKSGWAKELNFVSWTRDGHDYPKYDIRDWNSNHTEYGKGITLSSEEFSQLKDFFLTSKGDTKITIPEDLL